MSAIIFETMGPWDHETKARSWQWLTVSSLGLSVTEISLVSFVRSFVLFYRENERTNKRLLLFENV